MGGFLTESSLGWPFSFHIPGIIAFAVAIFALISLPPASVTDPEADVTTKTKRPSIDYLGAALCTSAMLMLVFVLSEGNARGWSDPLIISLLILSLLLFGAFVFAEMKIKEPLMPPNIWLLPNFAAAFVIAMCVTAFFVNYTYYLTLIFQEVWGYNAVESAIRFVPVGVTAVIIALLAENLIHYFNIKMTLIAGLLLGLIGNVILGFYSNENEYWSKFFPSVIIGIAGLASTYTSVAITAFSAAPNNMAGLIGGVLNTAFQFGTGLGLAITTPVVSSVNGPSAHLEGADRHRLLKGYHAAIWTTVGIIGFALLIAIIFVKVIPKTDEDGETLTVHVDSGRKSKEEGSRYDATRASVDTVVVQA
ncbi:hypothetical protein HK097_000004 [Rhizophlyctis rosea]|uniref:Major facilitator superfamily (MFS) profile domain-containing protein n=1 Tax=Rhizophlyctis rosea TaxID=64517 RepID=A0AAD5SNJ6_9FUNG|nr:hypothetical protein HK097_000004 [Rhizophlyctis rosea]